MHSKRRESSRKTRRKTVTKGKGVGQGKNNLKTSNGKWRHSGGRRGCDLGEGVGRGEPVAAAVLINGGRANESIDAVVGTASGGERLEQEHSDALAAHVPVGTAVEGLAMAVAAEEAGLGQGHADGGREQHVGAAGKGGRAFALADRAARQMKRNKRTAVGRQREGQERAPE